MSSQIIKTDSRFLHGEDLRRDGKWCEFSLTVKSVGEKDSIKSEDKSTVEGYPFTFEETDKIAVLKGSNIRLAQAALETSDRTQMTGKKLIVYPVMGNWFGQRDVIALRVRVPQGMPRPFIQPKNLGRDLTR